MGTVMTTQESKEFWNKRAKTFPRYSPDENSYEAGLLQLARDHGALFRDKNILDVGCGCGMYTIRLALEGRSVTALDLSDEMLSILAADARKMGLDNIEYVNSGWLEYSGGRAYDLIFCSMTPALHSEEGKAKVASFPGAQVVYIGWNGGPLSTVMAGLYEHYRVDPPAFDHAPEMRHWLSARGLEYIALPREGQWRVSFTKDEMAEQCRNHLSRYNLEPEPAFLGQYLEKFRQADGSYLEVTDYHVEMLIWRNDC